MDTDRGWRGLEGAHPIAQRLAGVLDAETPVDVLIACRAAIAEVIGCDQVLLTQLHVDDANRTFVAAGVALAQHPGLTRELVDCGVAHPVVSSYLRLGDDGSPRRASDVADRTTWAGHVARSAAFRECGGTHQLSMVVSLSAKQGRGWILTRGARDFSNVDVQRAGLLLPALTVIDRLCEPQPSSYTPLLTAREHQVLRLIAGGLSARVIARHLGISDRTVTKHCEHLYRKLGASDRVSAINAARRLGLLVASQLNGNAELTRRKSLPATGDPA